MMYEPEKSDSAVVATKPANKEPGRATGGGAGGAKGGDREERETAKHVPGTEPEKRVTGAGPRAASRNDTRLPAKILPVGAGCLNWARPDLCGGRSVMTVPTANTKIMALKTLRIFAA
jgi:hypothetical protein